MGRALQRLLRFAILDSTSENDPGNHRDDATTRRARGVRYRNFLYMESSLPNIDRLNHLASIIFDAAITVHREMGPGLLESVYHKCMIKEFNKRGIDAGMNVPVPLFYKGDPLNKDYIIDILIEDEIIIELKAVEGILPVHEARSSAT